MRDGGEGEQEGKGKGTARARRKKGREKGKGKTTGRGVGRRLGEAAVRVPAFMYRRDVRTNRRAACTAKHQQRSQNCVCANFASVQDCGTGRDVDRGRASWPSPQCQGRRLLRSAFKGMRVLFSL